MSASGDHGTIMGLIDKDIAPKYKELAVQFCIPQGRIGNIGYDNRNNSLWDGLNTAVYMWLQGNTEVYDDGVKANSLRFQSKVMGPFNMLNIILVPLQ
uniref:Uncharacterized protein n=1 Tax=Amphimedon queenslandica TaxID=400682 RepID=A0A1X7T4G3_AMPQE